MDSAWAELCVGTTHTFSSRAGVSAVAFDPAKELLWAGTDDVSAQPYTLPLSSAPPLPSSS